jgi:thiol:disulfide interchange protein DsbG
MKYIFLLILLLNIIGGNFAHAADQKPLPAFLLQIQSQGAEIHYLGNDLGVDGWMALYQGNEQFFYIPPSGNAIITGLLMNPKGEIITADQVLALSKKKPEFDYLDSIQTPDTASATETKDTQSSSAQLSEQLFGQLEQSHFMSLGKKGAPIIYSFVDPNCPHCHKLIRQLQQTLLKEDKIELRAVLVGFKDGSLKQAAYMLNQPNADDIWAHIVAGQKDIFPKDLQSSATILTAPIEENMQLMQQWNLTDTPTSFYRDATGKIQVIRGIPKDMDAIYKTLP